MTEKFEHCEAAGEQAGDTICVQQEHPAIDVPSEPQPADSENSETNGKGVCNFTRLTGDALIFTFDNVDVVVEDKIIACPVIPGNDFMWHFVHVSRRFSGNNL